VAGLHDDSGGPPGSIKSDEYLAMLSDYWLLRSDCNMEFI